MKNTILLFYKYVDLADTQAIIAWQKELGARLSLTGRVIVAPEGINGTVGGAPEAVEHYIQALRAHPDFADTDIKQSSCTGAPFGNGKFRVLVRTEIVRLGIDPQEIHFSQAARRLSPQEAHERITQRQGAADFVILDARNTYESRVGAFQGAITPDIDTFAQFPEYVTQHQELFKGKEVLMYCTGGVRCERASAYLMSLGIAQEVTHIQGGIDRYVQAYPEGYFKGHNYVFDGRVTVPVTPDMLASCDRCGQPGRQVTNCVYTRCNDHLVVCQTCSSVADPLVCSTRCAHEIQQHPEHQRSKPSITACAIPTA